jgi:hypothetical protein
MFSSSIISSNITTSSSLESFGFISIVATLPLRESARVVDTSLCHPSSLKTAVTLSLIIKRALNILAARKSRERKAVKLEDLEKRIEELKTDRDR